MIGRALVSFAGRCTQANDWKLAKSFLIGAGVDEKLEQLAMQHAEIVGDAELRPCSIVLRQHDAEVVIANIRREIVAHDAINAPVQLRVDDVGLQDLDQRKRSAGLHATVHLNRDDLEFNRVAITRGIVPMRQVIETVVDHLQGFAQVLLAALSTRQIGEICGEASSVQWLIAFIESDAIEAECEVLAHDASL